MTTSLPLSLLAPLVLLVFHYFIIAPIIVSSYTIAPITKDMQDAAAGIIKFQLPPGGVTQESSISWQRLAYICDTFGPRFSGSQALEDALTHIKNLATQDGLKVTEQVGKNDVITHNNNNTQYQLSFIILNNMIHFLSRYLFAKTYFLLNY